MDSNELAEETKLIILGLLTSLKETCTVKQLCNDYISSEGREIPYKKLGYGDVFAYLNSIPDVLRLTGNGLHATVEVIVSSKSKHVDILISKSRQPTKKKKKRTGVPRSRPRPRPPLLDLPARPPKCMSYEYSHPLPTLFDRKFEMPVSKPSTSTPQKCMNKSLPSLLDQKFEMPVSQPSTSTGITHSGRSSAASNYNEVPLKKLENRICTTNKTLEMLPAKENSINYKEIFNKSPEISPAKENSINYKEILSNVLEIKEDVDMVDSSDNNNSNNMIQTSFKNVQSLQNTSFKDLQPHITTPFKKVQSSQKVSFKDMHSNVHYKSSRVPQNVQESLYKLIVEFPDGLQSTELLNQYRIKYHRNLSYERYNYRSVIEMCSDLPHIFHFVQSSSCDFILFDKNISISNIAYDLKKLAIKTEEDGECNILDLPKLDWTSSKTLIPSDVVHLSEIIPRLALDFTTGDYVDLSMGEIYDLSKFWTYLTFGDLEKMMEQLQAFFQSHRNKYLIPETLLDEGLYCVTLFGKEYHRAVIIDILPEVSGNIKVLYIDYGTVATIDTNEIWYLPKQFGEIPSQAIRTRLSNIMPCIENYPWTLHSIKRFNELIINKSLVAEVIKVDKKEQILEVYLADISNPDKIFYINDVFVQEGLAVYVDQKQDTCLKDSNCHPIVEHLHIYPSFDDIEAGLAPTVSEFSYICENNITIDHIFPKYFNRTNDIDDIDYIINHHETYKKSTGCAKFGPLTRSSDFDYSLFPPEMLPEIKDIVKNMELTTSVNKGDKHDLTLMNNSAYLNDISKSKDTSPLTSCKQRIFQRISLESEPISADNLDFSDNKETEPKLNDLSLRKFELDNYLINTSTNTLIPTNTTKTNVSLKKILNFHVNNTADPKQQSTTLDLTPIHKKGKLNLNIFPEPFDSINNSKNDVNFINSNNIESPGSTTSSSSNISNNSCLDFSPRPNNASERPKFSPESISTPFPNNISLKKTNPFFEDILSNESIASDITATINFNSKSENSTNTPTTISQPINSTSSSSSAAQIKKHATGNPPKVRTPPGFQSLSSAANYSSAAYNMAANLLYRMPLQPPYVPYFTQPTPMPPMYYPQMYPMMQPNLNPLQPHLNPLQPNLNIFPPNFNSNFSFPRHRNL